MVILITENQYKRILNESGGCNYFKDITNRPDYDHILQDEKQRVMWGVDGSIMSMTPEEYLDRCAQLQGISLEDEYKITDQETIKKMVTHMKGGKKYDLPYIDYSGKEQDGRHRVVAAGVLGCEKIEVAVFIARGEKDPYVIKYRDEPGYTISEMYRKWPDVVIGDDNNYAIEYKVPNDLRGFKMLYPTIEDDDEILMSSIYGLPLKLEKSDSDFNTNMGDINFDNMFPPEFKEVIKKVIFLNVTPEEYDEQWGANLEEDLSGNIPFTRLGFIVGSFRDKLPDLYQYLKDMISSIESYVYILDNKWYFEEVEYNDYRVEFESDKRRILLYTKETYYNDPRLYPSAKDMIKSEGVKLKNDKPKNMRNTLPGKLVVQYIKLYPYEG